MLSKELRNGLLLCYGKGESGGATRGCSTQKDRKRKRMKISIDQSDSSTREIDHRRYTVRIRNFEFDQARRNRFEYS